MLSRATRALEAKELIRKQETKDDLHYLRQYR